MLPCLLLCLVVTKTLCASLGASNPRSEAITTMAEYSGDVDNGGRYRRGQPSDPNASVWGQSTGQGQPGPLGNHGAPTDPNASVWGRPSEGQPSPVGVHGGPTDPNASVHGSYFPQPIHSGTSSLRERRFAEPLPYTSGRGISTHGAPTDPNASIYGTPLNLGPPGPPAGPSFPPPYGNNGVIPDVGPQTIGQQVGPPYPNPIGNHGQPTNPNASIYGRPTGST